MFNVYRKDRVQVLEWCGQFFDYTTYANNPLPLPVVMEGNKHGLTIKASLGHQNHYVGLRLQDQDLIGTYMVGNSPQHVTTIAEYNFRTFGALGYGYILSTAEDLHMFLMNTIPYDQHGLGVYHAREVLIANSLAPVSGVSLEGALAYHNRARTPVQEVVTADGLRQVPVHPTLDQVKLSWAAAVTTRGKVVGQHKGLDIVEYCQPVEWAQQYGLEQTYPVFALVNKRLEAQNVGLSVEAVCRG